MPFQKGDNSQQKRKRKSSNPPPPIELTVGRPSSYIPEYDEIVRRLRLLMMNKDEIATFFGVTSNTLDLWAQRHPSFKISYASGGEIADANIATALSDRAQGMWIEEEQAVKVRVGQFEDKIEIVKVRKFIPPDFASASLLLANRQRGKWKLKQAEEETNANINIKISGGLPDE